jgi:hypothetical protein
MDSDVTFNMLYSLLTKTDSEEYSTINFFKSLKYRNNGYRVVKVLESLNNYEVLKGFRYDDELVTINRFRSCQFRLNNINDIDEVVRDISKFSFIEEVSVLGDTVSFSVQEGEGDI